MADLDAAMPKLILSCKKDLPERVDAGSTEASASTASSSTALHLHLLRRCLQLLALRGVEVTTEDVINQVDQFLHKALQNPRERLSSKLSS